MLTSYEVKYQVFGSQAKNMSDDQIIKALSSLKERLKEYSFAPECLLANQDAYSDVLEARGTQIPVHLRGK